MTTPPTLGAYTRKATTAQAIQFDGTVPCLLAIFQARAAHARLVQVTLYFDDTGAICSATLSGQSVGLSFQSGDWVLFPDDDTADSVVVADPDFQRDWQ